MLAMSARDMLGRRGFRSSIVLGVERKPSVSQQIQQFGAHAWVCVAQRVVVGGDAMKGFTVVAAYYYSGLQKCHGS
jgi:hypothetical protein